MSRYRADRFVAGRSISLVAGGGDSFVQVGKLYVTFTNVYVKSYHRSLQVQSRVFHFHHWLLQHGIANGMARIQNNLRRLAADCSGFSECGLQIQQSLINVSFILSLGPSGDLCSISRCPRFSRPSSLRPSASSRLSGTPGCSR